MEQAQAPRKCRGQYTQEFPQVSKREFTRSKWASAKPTKACKNLQKRSQRPLPENLWVFLSKGPRHTLHARCMQKQLQGARARFQPPWLTACRKSRESPKNPRKTYRKVSLNLCGGLVVVWEGHSDGGGLCATSSGASSEGSSQQQREAKSQ